MFDARAALDAILPHLDRGDAPASKWPDHKGEYWALCPFHPDRSAGNFSVSERGYKCFSCGAKGSLAERLHIDLEGFGLQGCRVAQVERGIVQKSISLVGYAEAKRLPVDFLQATFGVSERRRGDRVGLRLPYLGADGRETAVRYRIALTGDKFRWATRSRLSLYGLWLLDGAAADVILVEGESDTQTLAYHGIPALGVPGATNWQPAWAEALAGRTVYAWQEPDKAGAAFVARIAADIPDLRVMAAPAGYKGVSAAHIAGEDVPALIARLAADLLAEPSILAEFGTLRERLGLVGETRIARLLYLALTARFLTQTARVPQVLADRASGEEPAEVDLTSWHAVQTWLALAGCQEVTIPYAHALAQASAPRAVRLRRDFGAVLNLVRGHAMLQQKSRARDERGRIVATLADYAAVYELVIDTVSEGAQATVSSTIRETVRAVAEIDKETGLPVTVTKLAERLGIDKSAALRRANVAIREGYVVNAEDKKGRPAKLAPGEPLPAEPAVLPNPADLNANICTIPSTTCATLQPPIQARPGSFRLSVPCAASPLTPPPLSCILPPCH